MISPVITSVVFFALILATVSVVAVMCINKFVSIEKRVALRMVTQPTLTVVGMMFSILLGFFIAQSMRDYSSAASCAVNEANGVGDVFRLARGLGESDRVRIRSLCRKYVDVVINEEWALMTELQDSQNASQVMQDLYDATLSIQAANSREQIVFEKTLTAMDQLAALRRARIGTNSAGIAPYLWVIIACGGAAIVSLTFMFAPDCKRFHAVILCCLLIPLMLNIFLLAEYAYPFAGLVSLKPKMFELVKQRIMTQDDSAPKYLAPPAVPVIK